MHTNIDWRKAGPVTQQRCEAAQQWLIDNAGNVAQAKADRDKADHMIKVNKAMVITLSDKATISAKETEALASDQYQQAINEHFNANLRYEELFATRKAAETLIDLWRSINSNLRSARV